MAMAQLKSKWTDSVYTRVKVLNHSNGLRLERFTSEELDQIADCDDVLELTLDRSKMKEPLDLARIAHITSLRKLELEGLKFTNLQALRALPHLGTLIIDNCKFSDFDALNGFKVLSHLYLWHNKLTAFPAGLDLPQFEALFISDNLISDLGFVQSYPGLAELYLKRNQITDLSPLAACPAVVDLDVQDNPVTSLAPLAGRKFTSFYADPQHREEQIALRLKQDEWPRGETITEDDKAPRHVADLMAKNDWPALYAITDLALLGRAFASLLNRRGDAATLRGALAHPAEGAFHAMVANGLCPDQAMSDLLVHVLCGYGERTIAPMTECFYTALARPSYQDEFYVGKMKNEHEIIMCVLTGIASPACTELFLAFFNEREGFSENYLYLCKHLLDVVGKTKSEKLMEPIMDLLRFEQKIIGGDPAFMKKIFKAIGQLGRKADAAVLASRFNAAAEERPDVLLAYEATLARLEKKKA
ncbi:MAG: leucine-rich repeat domain-containing protein [Acidovorax sp.]|nr:leucine-rich repeat domain-containing protein [Acidovorax sp.]